MTKDGTLIMKQELNRQMRKANTADMFKIGRLITDLGVKEQLFEAQKNKEIDKLEEIGFDFFYAIFEKAVSEEVEKKIYDVLSGPFEMTAEEIGKMAFSELLDGFVNCFDLEVVVNFIKRALPAIKK